MNRKIDENPFSATDLFLRNYFDRTVVQDFVTVVDSKINYPLDVIKNPTALILEIACVGASMEDITLTINQDVLRIVYDSKSNEDKREYVKRSISRKSFDLGYKVSAKYNLDAVDAVLDKGLLIVTLPLAKEATSKKINIRSIPVN